MSEYFITARSFAAPFVSDPSEAYVEADSPQAALEQYVAEYRHPCGLYAAEAWRDHKHSGEKGADPLAQWLSNHERAKREATKDKPAYTYMGMGTGKFEIDREVITVKNPTEGSLV